MLYQVFPEISYATPGRIPERAVAIPGWVPANLCRPRIGYSLTNMLIAAPLQVDALQFSRGYPGFADQIRLNTHSKELQSMGSAYRCLGMLAAIFCIWPVTLAWAASPAIRIVPAISDAYILDDDLPETDRGAQSISIVMAPDQFEPASFVVYAGDALPDLRVTATQLRDPQGRLMDGGRIDIRVVKRWYQRNFAYATNQADPRTRFLVPELLLRDDSLIQVRDRQNFLKLESGEYVDISKPGNLNGFGTPRPEDFPVRDAPTLQPLEVAAGDNRQFWVTAYVPPGAKPGNYVAEIILRSGAAQFLILPVAIEVLPFSLSKPRIDYSFYYRGILSNGWPNGSVSSEYKSEAQMLDDFRNMREHGIKNPTVYQPLASGALEKVLQLRTQAGIAADKMFYLGVDIAPSADVAKPDEYRAQLPAKISSTLKIASAFDIRKVYFYARDEARDSHLLEQIPYWDTVRRAGGLVMAAGWRSESSRPGNFDATGGNEDLFNALGMPSRFESAQWHAKGKLIYSYQNPTGGEELPETWRRNYGLLLWQYDYDGAMPYAWQHSYADAWNDFDHMEYRDHNFTYPTIDGSIDTLQWEGVRAAVDDSRYLATLMDALESPAGKISPHAAEVRAWLQELKNAPLARLDLSSIREQMIGHILALRPQTSATLNDSAADLSAEGVQRDIAAAGNEGSPGGTAVANQAVATSDKGSFDIGNLQVGPLLADGEAVLSWQTPVRATSRVDVVDPRTRRAKTFESGALDLRHAIRLTGLQPGLIYEMQVKSEAVDGQKAAVSSRINTGTGITTEARERADSAGNITVEVAAASNYRASIGINWQKSLLGWWRFSSARNAGADLSGNDFTATLQSGAVPGDGWFGRGVRLNGAGAHVDASQIRIAKNGRATIEGWFRFRSFAMDNKSQMGIFSGIYQHEGNNHFYFNGTNDYFAVASLLTLGAWHHIALTWDGDTGSALLYVDGQQLRPVLQDAIDNIDSVDGLRIGDNTGFLGKLMQRSSGTFDGEIDEVRVWNRVLSAGEIRASFNANSSELRAEFAGAPGASRRWSIIGANAADQLAGD